MSVQYNIYLMYGMKIDPETLPKDELDEPIWKWGDTSPYSTKVTHKDNLFMLYDGMNCEYCILGHVIGKISDDGDYDLDSVQEIGNLSPKIKKLVQESIKRNFDLEPNCKYYLINHYS